MHRFWIVLAAFATLIPACHPLGGTVTRAQELASHRWSSCAARFPRVALREILADGQIWLSFNETTDVTAVRECLRAAGGHQSRYMAVIKPPEEMTGANAAVFHFPVKAEVTFGDIGTLTATAVAVVAAGLALFQLRVMSRQSRTDILLTIDERWEQDEAPMGKARDEVSAFYRDNLRIGLTPMTARGRLVGSEDPDRFCCACVNPDCARRYPSLDA